jgi:hypothetical protein
MKGMQCYRLRTILCDTADMAPNTISTLLLIRRASHFVPLHSPDSPDSADSLIFLASVRESGVFYNRRYN